MTENCDIDPLLSRIDTSTTEYFSCDIDPELDQKFFLMSMVKSKTDDDKTYVEGVKIRGAFSDYDEAVKYSKYLNSKHDNSFDIHIGKIGNWIYLDRESEKLDSIYADEKLNGLIKEHTADLNISKEEFASNKEKSIDNAKKLLDEYKQRRETGELDEIEEIDTSKDEFIESTDKLNDIHSELKSLQSKYEKIRAK